MHNVDQRGFDNQSSAYLGAREAAAFLGVKLQTLYAYAARGLVGSMPGERGRARRYLRADLERLRARHDARSGHGPVAAGALRWGEPVLESGLTRIGEEGPAYRGKPAIALARAGTSFEAVAELLWTGALPPRRPVWGAGKLGLRPERLAALLPPGSPPGVALALAVPALAARDPGRFDPPPEAERERARELVLRMAACLALARDAAKVERALEADGVAKAVLVATGGPVRAEAQRATERALVLCADHELNPSSFAARVAASAGSDLYACVSAALATHAGPLHGGACDRIEALVAETDRPDRARAAIHERLQRGEAIAGFGHPLYPRGDPRAPPLLETARALAPRDQRLRTLLALVEAMREVGREPPTVDLGLAAVSAALGLAPGMAVGIFAVGRAAGWIAHALEQRQAGFLLRPRARYVGP